MIPAAPGASPPAAHARALAMLLVLATAPALAAPPGQPPTAIDALAGPVRSRILTGTSSEGTSVEATTRNGQYTRIVAEALNETGRTIEDFRFDHGHPVRARIVRVGYKGYPDVNLAAVPPHQHLVIDPTDTVISDRTYDLTPKAALCTSPDCATARQDAALYLRLMNTPSPGRAEDGGNWVCTPAGNPACPAFTQEAVP